MADKIIITADTSPAIRELDRLGKKLEDISNKFKDNFGKMSENAKNLGLALAAAGAAVASYADDISDVAAANQVAIEQVLGLSKALEGSGGKAENVGKMFQTMSNNIEEANGGNLKTLTTFQKLGVTLEDLGKKSNTALKDQLLDGLVSIKDPIERNALAMQVFGKSLVGVDIEKFAAEQKKLAAEMAPYAASIETAGNAWDNMVSILGTLKLAFAEAFQPVFWLLSKISINTEVATVAFRLLALGVAAVAAPAVLAGMASLINLVKTLTLVAAKNPFIAVATALLAIGPSVVSYLGLMKDTEEQQTANNEATKEGVRSQEGLNAAIKKELDALTQVQEALNKNWKKSLDKFDLEFRLLSLSEEQKKVAEEKAKIEQESQDALYQLKQKFEALDKDARARTQDAYKKEQESIQKNAEAQKKAVEAKIKLTDDYTRVVRNFTSVFQNMADAEQKVFDAQAKQMLDNAGYRERIELEAKLYQIQKIRGDLSANLGELSKEERARAASVISQAVDDADLLTMSYEDIGKAIRDNIENSVKMGSITQDTADKITNAMDKSYRSVALGAKGIADANKQIADQSRTFGAGWNKAFRDYVDNAENAASHAQKIFQTLTQTLEDGLMRLFKTGKLGWSDMLQTMIDALMRSQIQQLMAKVMSPSVGGGSAGGSGGLFGGSIIPGILAEGGPAAMNRPYIVGERGPELFIPSSNGQMVPNSGLGGGGNVTYNISAVDALSFKQMLAKDPTFLHAVAEQGRRTIPGGR